MTKDEKIQFVKDLTASVNKAIFRHIEEGTIPENWDGIELRQLLADKFANSTYPRLMTGKRKREYNNTVLVNNL